MLVGNFENGTLSRIPFLGRCLKCFSFLIGTNYIRRIRGEGGWWRRMKRTPGKKQRSGGEEEFSSPSSTPPLYTPATQATNYKQHIIPCQLFLARHPTAKAIHVLRLNKKYKNKNQKTPPTLSRLYGNFPAS